MIQVNFDQTVGKIKPMHGVGQPPYGSPRSKTMHYLKEAGIPYSRLHDVCGPYGGHNYVDVPNIFRDFDADENLPESYDFAFTDVLLAELAENNCEPVYRLGITIECYEYIKAYRTFPPKDYLKWAKICEHIIKHYNEGWADGFHYGIKYWEIWNEPEGVGNWNGTPEEFYAFYTTAAKHLKECFGDRIMVGGYGSSGFFSIKKGYDEEGNIKDPTMWLDYAPSFMVNFLKYIKKEQAPFDFFSWHTYSDVKGIVAQYDFCRKFLAKYGFDDVPDLLTEWNTTHDKMRKNTASSAANVLAFMLVMQKRRTSMLNYYDARIGIGDYAGLFDSNTYYPCKEYFTLMSFNQLYKLKNEVYTKCTDENVYVCAARKEDKAVLLIANINDEPIELEFEFSGLPIHETEILMINDIYHYSPTGKEIVDGKLTVNGNTCVEIRFH